MVVDSTITENCSDTPINTREGFEGIISENLRSRKGLHLVIQDFLVDFLAGPKGCRRKEACSQVIA